MIATKSRITFADLKHVPFTKPIKAGALWIGTPHVELLSAVCAAGAELGWEATGTKRTGSRVDAIALSDDTADIVASFTFLTGNVTPPSGFDFMIGIRNSNARRFAMSVTAGLRHNESGAMIALGEIPVGRQRKGRFNLQKRLARVMAECSDLFAHGSEIVQRLAARAMGQTECESLVCTFGNLGIIPWSRLGKLHFRTAAADQMNALKFLFFASALIDLAPLIARRGQMDLRVTALQTVALNLRIPMPEGWDSLKSFLRNVA